MKSQHDDRSSTLIQESTHMIFSPLTHLQALLFLIQKSVSARQESELDERIEKAKLTVAVLTRRMEAVIYYLSALTLSEERKKESCRLDEIIKTAIENTNTEARREKISFDGAGGYELSAHKEELIQGFYFLFQSLTDSARTWSLSLPKHNVILITASDSHNAATHKDADEEHYQNLCAEIAGMILKRYGIRYEVTL